MYSPSNSLECGIFTLNTPESSIFLGSLSIKLKQSFKGVPLNKCSYKVSKILEKYLWKSSCSWLFLKDFAKMKSFYVFEIQEQLFWRNTSFFWIKNRMVFKQKIECFESTKTSLFLFDRRNFRKMASNKHVDLRKTENFV